MALRGTLVSVVTATALLIGPETPASELLPAPRRGPFAFQYAPSLTPEQVAWYGRFDLLVTHDPLPPEQVQALQKAGTRLLFYEWSSAFYQSRATPWQKSLLRTKKGLLHQRPLRGGVGSTTAPAWYFDPANERQSAARAAELLQRVEEHGYDGIFFDTTRFESVHPDARGEFARRHPNASYDAAFSRFLQMLRARTALVFTNQGYRSPGDFLPNTDWDLTESLITQPVEGGAMLRAWSDERDPWNSIHFVLTRMIEPLQKQYPRVRFAHLNYIDEPAADVIHASVAVAQLFDGEAFVAAPALGDERNEIYFRDPGAPLGPRVDWAEDGGAHRFFTNGLIVISASAKPHTIPIGEHTLRNHFTGEVICGGEVTIPPSPGTARAWFFDAVATCPGKPPDTR